MIRLLIFPLSILVLPASGQWLTPTAPPPDPRVELRVCGKPARDADGRIARSMSVLAAYKRLHPCPVTGKATGACPGWAVNHVIPLAKGGCDSVVNLQWLPVQVKSCAADYCIDRWERRYYGQPHGVIEPIQ